MRVLHVAAQPFPTRQGTQAAIASMLDASQRAGRDAQLLTYGGHGEGAATSAAPRYSHRRGAKLVGRDSLRSGPSLRKLAQDVQLSIAARALAEVQRPDVLVGHHVEGAAACMATGARTVFFAHTDLADELPAYFPSLLAGALRGAGAAVDRALSRRCHAVATISPWLRQRLVADTPQLASRIHHVPLPWPVAAPIESAERAGARAHLGIDAGAQVALYAGNLDAYQGIDALVAAVALARRRLPRLQLLIATDSDGAPLRRHASAQQLEALRFTTLAPEGAAGGADAEHMRRLLHAAADVVVVPRGSRGGLPIKLIDALARGVPTVAMPAALAGIDYGDALAVSHAADASALASVLIETLANPTRLQGLRDAGPRYVAQHHDDAAYLRAIDACCASAMRP